MKLQERLLIRTWSCTGTRSLTCLRNLVTLPLEGLRLATFVAVSIKDCHRNRLRAGPAVLKALTEAWTGTSLTERCGRIWIFPDENPGTSDVRSPDEHSNESRTTLCRLGSSEAVRVSSEGTRFLTISTVPDQVTIVFRGLHCPPLPPLGHPAL